MPAISPRVSTFCPGVRSYNANVLQVTGHTIEKPYARLYGIELEYQLRTYNTSRFIDLTQKMVAQLPAEFCILKEDASIHDGYSGVELVTVPASVNMHMKAFEQFYDDPDLSYYLVSKNHIGMHVHVNRRSLSRSTRYNLIGFINRFANRESIVKIAGRQTSYAQFQSFYTESVGITELLDRSHRTSKYSALNISPLHTYEFRIFQVPANYKQFEYRLQFVDASISFARSRGGNCTELDFSNFTTWLFGTPLNRWSGLKSFIVEEQLC